MVEDEKEISCSDTAWPCQRVRVSSTEGRKERKEERITAGR